MDISSSHQVNHQVFLSFRGPDTRQGFTSHLLQALKDKGISVFFDEETLEKGEELSQALLLAIEKSQIAIIILSEDYASSKSCLIELSKIMEHKYTGRQIVVPIFYHVNPSDVRHHGGSFRKLFEEHQWRRHDNQVQRWKDAFAKVGELKGWHIEGGIFDRSEACYIKNIVEDVIEKLNSKSTSGSKEFVGIDYQIEMILRLVNEENTRAVGIWGLGGIGKTTLAEIVYNEVSPSFASHCFIPNVREELEAQGVKLIRNEHLSVLLKQNIRIDTPYVSSSIIQQRLKNKNVFVVLDDVNDVDQIDRLGVKHFGHGSKILITSRDQQVLKNVADKIYEVQTLNYNHSLQLFSKFAFKQLNPAADFQDLSMQFVDYARGLPLALKVLGQTLFQKSREVWKSALQKVKESPTQSILKVLQISFDGLDEVEKAIFLDIAFFFNFSRKDDAKNILSCCYQGAQFVISSLVDKCLVDDMSKYNIYSMHGLLQEMGREIVRQESINDPGKRSRLWNPKDVFQVFKNNKGTQLIEGIILDLFQTDLQFQLSSATFEKMINLRILKIYSEFIGRTNLIPANSCDPPYLPEELRCLWWEYYPWKSLHTRINPKNLVVLRLTFGEMEQLWNDEDQDMINLRELNLFGCEKLRKIPNLLKAINFESLDCQLCKSLEEVPSLKHLTSLKHLWLLKNYKLKNFPEIPRDFDMYFDLQNTEIEEVPDSIELATRIGGLNMRYSKVKKVSSNIYNLESLQHLDFSYCPIENLSSSISKLDALSYLGLLNCPNITELNFGPSSIKSLKELYVSVCETLKLLLNLPSSVETIKAHGCTSLEKVSFTDQYISEFYFDRDNDNTHTLMFSDCFELDQDSIDNIVTNAMVKIGFLAESTAKYKYRTDKFFHGCDLCCYLPGNEILQMFEHQSNNSSINLKIEPKRCNGIRFLVFTLCFVVDLQHCFTYDTEIKHDLTYDYITWINCQGRLKGKGGRCKKFEFSFRLSNAALDGKNVCVLFGNELIEYDKDYEEASFEFYFISSKRYTRDLIPKNEERRAWECSSHQSIWNSDPSVIDNIRVEKYGVHLSYVEYNDEEIDGYFSSDIEEVDGYFNSDVEEVDGEIERKRILSKYKSLIPY